MVEDYLQQLVEEGDLDSSGRITLDPSKARQKLADSRFSHSSEALVAVISAYLLAGASEIRVSQTSSGWTFVSDARPPSAVELATLMQDMFSDGQPAALRELALAFNSLYPKQCQSLELITDSQRGWFENGNWKTQAIPPQPVSGMRLVLQRQPSLREWWKWLTRRWVRLSDLQILQARTRWSPAPVRFQRGDEWPSSYELDPPALPTGTLATLHIQCPLAGLDLPAYAGSINVYCHYRLTRARTTLRCALLPGDPRSSQLLLVYRGLILARHHLVGSLVRFHGVLNTDSLDLDATRQHVVQNQRLRQRTETARQWVMEGTAAWLKQLDPDNLSPEVHGLLLELLNRVNNSSGHKQILAALDRLPMIVLGDGTTSLSLGSLRQSLVRFPALHAGLENEIHGRPLLHPTANNLKGLSRLLRAPIVEATPWVRASERGAPVEQGGIDFANFRLVGPDWQASLHLPLPYDENQTVLRRLGLTFLFEKEGLFPVPTSFHIFLEGEYDGPLDTAQNRVLNELRAAILDRVPGWLDQVRQSGNRGFKGEINLKHYASLVCLWMRGDPNRHRTPSKEMLEYGSETVTRNGISTHALLALLKDRKRLEQFEPNDPIRKLAEWI